MIQYLTKKEELFFQLVSQPILDFNMLGLLGKQQFGRDFIENTSKKLAGTLNQGKLSRKLKELYRFSRPDYVKFDGKAIADKIEEIYGFTLTQLPATQDVWNDGRDTKSEISPLYSHESSEEENGVCHFVINISDYEIYLRCNFHYGHLFFDNIDNDYSFDDVMGRIEVYIFGLFPRRKKAINRDRLIDEICG